MCPSVTTVKAAHVLTQYQRPVVAQAGARGSRTGPGTVEIAWACWARATGFPPTVAARKVPVARSCRAPPRRAVRSSTRCHLRSFRSGSGILLVSLRSQSLRGGACDQPNPHMSASGPWDMASHEPGGPAARPLEQLQPPVPLLVIAGFFLAFSALLLLAGTFSDLLHVLGWFLASVVAIYFVARFTAVDLERRQRPNYAPQPNAGRARMVVAAAAVALCAAHAWTLAWSLAAR